MKAKRTVAVLTTIATLGLGFAVTTATASPAPVASTSSSLASTLAFNREEERMAQDLYAALAAKYDQARPMSMITRSETQHFESIGSLLATYGVTDPAAGLPSGSYAFPELQALYDGWLAKGSTSLNAAYQVGVELEQRDIADLQHAIAQTSEPDVLAVYQRLLAASERHLSAYERAVAGGTQTGSGGGSAPGRANGNRQGLGAGMHGNSASGRGAQGGRGMNGQGANGQGMNGQGDQAGPGAGQQSHLDSCPLSR